MLKQLAKILVLFILISLVAYSQDQPETEKQENTKAWNTVCPIDGNPVDADIITIEHKGKVYGFDSKSCATLFSEDPELYVVNLQDDGTKFVKKLEVKQSDKDKE
jgi:YHS domain-containing protein